ncbi:30S ribosomal protein S10, chloroplastic [Ananas comosus]|uniref:Small ribosomal subunit protein uS10c n=1 Tax=Ananas comosus TaxID=4615 RepID=A0A199VNU3_ANACO|nr:30S ribosomal protein S10, chloroplastic [Ananas comosus]
MLTTQALCDNPLYRQVACDRDWDLDLDREAARRQAKHSQTARPRPPSPLFRPMASLSAVGLLPLPFSNSPKPPPKPSLSFSFRHSPASRSRSRSRSKSASRPISSRVFASSELLDPQELDAPQDYLADSQVPETSLLSSEAAADNIPPKQKIRIKLRSYWVPLIEDSCKQILDAARNTNAKTMGPVPLPTKKRVYCVLKSPHVHKDARFHFEIRTHQRLIDILYPTAQTIDSLMQLDLPAGVDVEVKL